MTNKFKYEYLLNTWGGFYKKEYRKLHGMRPGYHYFNTENERKSYLLTLKEIEKKLNARHLATTLSEGYNCGVITTLHRIINFDNKEHYSKYKMSPNYPYDAAQYYLTWKWYPGFNDYPLGEDFDYDKVEIVQEWITGAFVIEETRY